MASNENKGRMMIAGYASRIQMTGAALLTTLLSYRLATVGFNPSDDGLILAQSQRILAGEIPHRDFLTPRPAGSPLLHSLELLLPTPQIVTSRLIVFIQLLVISVTLCFLICRRSPLWANTTLRIPVIVGVMTLNTHQFPLMPWHTIDGIMFCLLGIFFIEKSKETTSAYLLPVAALFIGVTPVIKQSFAPSLVVGAVLILLCKHQMLFNRILSIVMLTIPVALYLVWIQINDGLSAMTAQLFSSPMPSTVSLWSGVNRTILIICVATCIFGIARLKIAKRTSAFSKLNVLLSIAVSSSALYVVATGQLRLTNWSTPLLFLSTAAVFLSLSTLRNLLGVSAAIVALGFMTSLSWGYPNSNLISGGLLLISLLPVTALARTLPKNLTSRFSGRFITTFGAWATSLLLIFVLYESRLGAVYRDVPYDKQTSSLSSISSNLLGIRSNPNIYQVLNDVKDCLDKYPARYLAVLPDASIFPFLFEKDNPLKVDWWTPSELVVIPKPIFNENSRATNYLILFQSVTMATIAQQNLVPDAQDVSSIANHGDDLMQRLYKQFPGDSVICGSLIGKHQLG